MVFPYIAGSRVPSHVYSGGYLEPAELDELADEGVVGDVATVFYRADGSSDGIALNDRATGPSLDLLRGIPRRLCIVSGVSKLASLRGALAAHIATDLIVDEATARALVPLPLDWPWSPSDQHMMSTWNSYGDIFRVLQTPTGTWAWNNNRYDLAGSALILAGVTVLLLAHWQR